MNGMHVDNFNFRKCASDAIECVRFDYSLFAAPFGAFDHDSIETILFKTIRSKLNFRARRQFDGECVSRWDVILIKYEILMNEKIGFLNVIYEKLLGNIAIANAVANLQWKNGIQPL